MNTQSLTIRQKIRNYLSGDLVKVSSLNALSTVIKMFTSLVSVKVVASVIGPSGIALLGQLNNFSNIILSISNGGINVGMTKYVSEYSDSDKRNQVYLGTGFWITVVFSLLTSLVLVIFAGFFATTILKDAAFAYVFRIFGLTITLYAFNAILIAVINGFKEYKLYIITNIAGSVVGLLFSVVLSLRFGVGGALVAAVTFQSIVFIITLWLVRKAAWFRLGNFVRKFSWHAAGKLSHYSLMVFVGTVAVPGSQLIVRSYISEHVSIADAGLWEGVNRISLMYLLVIMTSLNVYIMPRLSEIKDRNELRNEVFNVYKLFIPFLAIATVTIYLLRFLIIRILFTDQFTEMEGLFGYQLIGDILKMSGWILGTLLIAKAMTRTYIIMEIVSFSFQVLFGIGFIKLHGTVGATMGYALGHLGYLLIMLFLLRRLLFSKNGDNDMGLAAAPPAGPSTLRQAPKATAVRVPHDPIVSIVMPMHNSAAFVAQTIDSILAQTFTDFEFIVIDDASTDGSREVVKRYDDPRIKLLTNPTNLGIVATRNRGIDEARGEFLAIIDSDDIALPGRLALQVEHLRNHPDIGLCGTWFQTMSSSGSFLKNIHFPVTPEGIRSHMLIQNCFCHSTVMMRTALARKERYSMEFPVAEDYELIYRVSRNTGITNLPVCTTKYRKHAGNISSVKRHLMFLTTIDLNRRFLGDLGIPFTEEELRTHAHALYYNDTVFQDEASLQELERWINKLTRFVSDTPGYDAKVFNRLIMERWVVICMKKKAYLKLCFNSLCWHAPLTYTMILLEKMRKKMRRRWS